MAWIESHQTVWDHPKTRRAARRLGIPDVQLVGHLHALWHWALNHAESGDLSRYDAEDVAIAARWDGSADEFVLALAECGPGGGSGFLDRSDEKLSLHNWGRYTERLVARRDSSRKANHDRWHAARGVRADGCEWCEDSAPTPDASPTESDPCPAGLRSDSEPIPTGHEPESTQPNPTAPDQPQPPSPPAGGQDGETDADDPPGDPASDVDEARSTFEEHFWPIYPDTNGRKPEKGKALTQWRKLTVEQRRRAVIGARNLARSDTVPKYAQRFLRKDTAGEFPFDDWQQPASPTRQRGSPPALPDRDADYTAGWSGKVANG